jgi:hypothetical protein
MPLLVVLSIEGINIFIEYVINFKYIKMFIIRELIEFFRSLFLFNIF